MGSLKLRLTLFPDWVRLLLILGVGLVLRLLFFTGMVGIDDAVHSDIAYSIVEGRYEPIANVSYLRLGLLLPQALIYKTLGVSELSNSLYPLATSLGTIVVAFILGRHWFGTATGIVSAGIVAIVPIIVRSSTILMTETPSAFFAGLSILLFVFGQRPKSRYSLILLFTSGLFLGIAYLTRESAIYLGVVLFAYTVYKGVSTRRIPWADSLVFAGFSLLFLAELQYLLWQTGDPLFRIHTTESDFNANIYWGPKALYPTPLAVIKRVFLELHVVTLFKWGEFGLLFWLAWAGVILGLFQSAKRLTFAAAWFLIMILLHSFGSTSLRAYLPLPTSPRYLSMLLLPAAVIGGYALVRISQLGNLSLTHGFIRRLFLVLSATTIIGSLVLLAAKPQVLWLAERMHDLLRGPGLFFESTFMDKYPLVLKLYFRLQISALLLSALLVLLLLISHFIRYRERGFLFKPAYLSYLTGGMFVIASIYGVIRYPGFHRATERVLVPFLEKNQSTLILTDSNTKAVLNFYLKYRRSDSIRDFYEQDFLLKNTRSSDNVLTPPLDLSRTHDAYIIVNWERLNWWKQHTPLKAPKALYEPPASWQKVASILAVDGERLVVYYAP